MKKLLQDSGLDVIKYCLLPGSAGIEHNLAKNISAREFYGWKRKKKKKGIIHYLLLSSYVHKIISDVCYDLIVTTVS